MLAVEILLDGIEGLVHHPLFGTDARHGAPALGLDEYLSLVVDMRPHGPSVIVIGPQEPFPVPSVHFDSFAHRVNVPLGPIRLSGSAQAPAEGYVVAAADYEQAGYHKRLGLRAFGFVLRGLERLVGIPAEAIEIQAVIPVRTTDERQAVRPEIVHHMVERYPQMLEKGHLRAGFIVKRNHLIEYGEVPRLLEVGNRTEDQPHRVVVESASDIVVATLAKRLVLMVAATVRELR